MAKPVSSPTRRAMIKTGSYTGNGFDARSINIGINLAAKSNVLVSVKGNNSSSEVIRIEDGLSGTKSMEIDFSLLIAQITGLTATGFQVGTDGDVNANGTLYWYIAIWQEG
jgi:hypothetical protein